jgi:drug/metabolite transporter (DMT)-like permease
MRENGKSLWNNPYLLMSIIVLLWSSFATVSKLVLNTSIDSFQLQFFIFLIAIVLMSFRVFNKTVISAFRKLSAKDYLMLCLYALPSYAYYLLYTLSLKLIPATEASMLNYLFPIMIVLLAVPILGEKLSLIKTAAGVLGLAGTIVILTGGNLTEIRISNVQGDLFALGAAVSWGLFSTLGKRNQLDPTVSNFVYVGVSFILSTITLFFFSKPVMPHTSEWIGLAWLSVSSIVLNYYLWFKVLKICSSALVASLSFITPFFTLILIVLILGEKISIIYLWGFLLIISGITVQTMEEIKSNKIHKSYKSS